MSARLDAGIADQGRGGDEEAFAERPGTAVMVIIRQGSYLTVAVAQTKLK